MSDLAIVPARGGSRRVPRKNIRNFLGVPLLERTIHCLRECGAFRRVIVSTDDDEIAEVARGAGAEVPFRRPPALADDFAGTVPVVAHAVRELERMGESSGRVCCVYPGAVLSLPADFLEAAGLLSTSEADYVIAATSFSYPIWRALRRTPDDGCEMLWPEYREARTQDLEPTFHDAGQFYFGRREAWLEERPLFSRRSRLFMIPSYRVQDIDTLEDWEKAERLFLALSSDRLRSHDKC